MVGKRVLRKLRIREIIRDYRSFLSIILIAILCVALFTGLYANYRNFQFRLNQFYEQTNMADFFVTTKSYDENDLDELSKIDGVEEIERRMYLPLEYENKTFTLIADECQQICKPLLKEGDMGILVSPSFLTSMKKNIHDEVTLYFDASSLNLANYPTELFLKENKVDYLNENLLAVTFTIDGTMTHPEDVERNSITAGLIYMTESNFFTSILTALRNHYQETLVTLATNLLEENKTLFINQYVLKTSKDVFESLHQYFYAKQTSNILTILAKDAYPTNSSIEMDVLQAKQLLFVFPIVFYLVGVLVIITSLKELIHKERKNIGVLSAIGFSKREIILHYSYISILLVSIGSLLGVIIGPTIIPNIMGNKYDVLYNLPSVRVPFLYIEYLWCFLIIVGICILSAILVSYQEVNRTPASILRDDNKKEIKKSCKSKPKKSLLAFKMSIRNMKLNVARSLMVLIGVLGCSALLACGFGIDDTLNYSVRKETNELIDYDLILSMDKEIDLSNDSIKEIDYFQKLSITALNEGKSYNTSLYIMESNREIFKPQIPTTRGCMISKRLSEDLNLLVSDTIQYIYDNETYSFEIIFIEEMSFTSGIFIDAHFAQVFQPNGAYLTLHDKNNIDLLKDELLSSGAISVTTKEELLTQADNILSGIRGITLTVKVFAILLALVVIYNLAQLNYKERIRDIATLKVLGFGKKEIAQVLLYELTILTLIGSVFGMFVGKPLLILLLKINQTSKFTYIYHINPISYLIAICLTLVISVIINLIITKLSDHIQMVESLKSVE